MDSVTPYMANRSGLVRNRNAFAWEQRSNLIDPLSQRSSLLPASRSWRVARLLKHDNKPQILNNSEQTRRSRLRKITTPASAAELAEALTALALGAPTSSPYPVELF
jgi:hypothetical protein